MFYCAHRKHRAVLRNIGPEWTQRQSFIPMPWMYLWKMFLVFELVNFIFLVATQCYSHFAIWDADFSCMQLWPLVDIIMFQSGVLSKCFIHKLYSSFRSKAVSSVFTKTYCCHLDKNICRVYCNAKLYFYKNLIWTFHV